VESWSLSFLITLLVTLILVSAFFSGSEIGMMALNRYRLRHLAKKQHHAAQLVQRLLGRTDRLLAVILIGNTFANILASALMTIIAMRLYGDVGVAVGTLLLTLVVLIFAEMTPKTIAARRPEQVAFVAVWPLSILLRIFWPIVWFTNAISNAFIRILPLNTTAKRQEHLTPEELRTVVHEASGLMPQSHRMMLLALLDLSDVEVDDIMVPANEISYLNLESDWDDLLHQIKTSQHTRLPICNGSLDVVIGIVHLRQVMSYLDEDEFGKETLLHLSEEPYYVLEKTPLSQQIKNFQREKRRSGLVVDEYGHILGLVTLEDILEEVVGEFTTDFADVHQDIHPQDDGSFIVDGSITIRELNRLLRFQLPHTGPKTLNGLIIEHLQFIPSEGIGLRIDDYVLEVVKVEDNKVKTAKILKLKTN